MKSPVEAVETAAKKGARQGQVAELGKVQAEVQQLQAKKGAILEGQTLRAQKAVAEAVKPTELKAVETAKATETARALETGKAVEAGKAVETARAVETGKAVETARVVETGKAVEVGNASLSGKNVVGVNGPLPGAVEVQFGKGVVDIARLTPQQIRAQTAGVVSSDGAAKIAEVVGKKGGAMTVADLKASGMSSADIKAFESAGKAATQTRLGNAQVKLNAQADALVKSGKYANRGAALEGVELKGMNQKLRAARGDSKAAASESPSNSKSSSKTAFDVAKPAEFHSAKAAEYGAQIKALQAESGKGLFGRIKRFTNSKKIKNLEVQKASHEAKAAELKGADPAALKTASEKLSMTGHQAKLHKALTAEYAKVDPNSRYGKALGERIRQVESTPGENFAKTTGTLVAISIGTNLFFNVWRQATKEGKVDLKKATEFLMTKEFWMSTGGLLGGVFAGNFIAKQTFYELLATRVTGITPLGGTFVKLFPAFALGAVGATILSGGAANADWGKIGAHTIGSTLGTAIAISMFAFGPIGQLVGALVGGFIAEKVLEMIRGEGPEAEATGRNDEAVQGDGVGESEAGAEGYADGSFTSEDVDEVMSLMKASYESFQTLEQTGKYGEAAEAFEQYIGLKRQLDSMRQTAYSARN